MIVTFEFSQLPLGAYFYFTEGNSPRYRKVGTTTYTYAGDHKARWTYYTPLYTLVTLAKKKKKKTLSKTQKQIETYMKEQAIREEFWSDPCWSE